MDRACTKIDIQGIQFNSGGNNGTTIFTSNCFQLLYIMSISNVVNCTLYCSLHHGHYIAQNMLVILLITVELLDMYIYVNKPHIYQTRQIKIDFIPYHILNRNKDRNSCPLPSIKYFGNFAKF